MKKNPIILSILLIASASYAQTYTVERVIDGDTIKLTTGERVRLIGIDTPESQPNDKAKRDAERTGQDVETINKMGQEATEFVKGLIKPGQEVRLEFDVQERDKYGRVLAYAYFFSCYVAIYSSNPDDMKLWYEIRPNWKVPDKYVDIVPKAYEPCYSGCCFPSWVMLNAYIVQSGYATPMTIPPNVIWADLFKGLYEEAREQKKGLWK